MLHAQCLLSGGRTKTGRVHTTYSSRGIKCRQWRPCASVKDTLCASDGQSNASPITSSTVWSFLAAAGLASMLAGPLPSAAGTQIEANVEVQQTQTTLSEMHASSGSANAGLLAAEAPCLVSSGGSVLLDGFKDIVSGGLHDLGTSSMTAVGGPVTGEVVSASSSGANNEALQEADSAGTVAHVPAAAAVNDAVPDLLTSPGQAGRIGLLCGFWQAYCNALETSPLVTKVYTGLVGTLLGDVLAQLLSHQQRIKSLNLNSMQRSSAYRAVHSCRSSRRSSSDGIAGKTLQLSFQFDARRCARLCLYSAAIGTPMGHYWYQVLEQHVMPGSPTAAAAIAAKVCMDQLLQTPFGMALFLGGMKVLEGRPGEVQQELQSKMLPALLANWKLWPAAQLINFALIPEQQRILYGNIVGICWTCIISNLQQASANSAPLEGILEEAGTAGCGDIAAIGCVGGQGSVPPATTTTATAVPAVTAATVMRPSTPVATC